MGCLDLICIKVDEKGLCKDQKLVLKKVQKYLLIDDDM